MAICTNCRQPFTPKRRHFHMCYPCWKESRLETSDNATDEICRLRQRIVELEIQLTLSAQRPVEPAEPIPQEMLRRLVQLCHPDRHNGSAAATQATQWLLEQRRDLLP